MFGFLNVYRLPLLIGCDNLNFSSVDSKGGRTVSHLFKIEFFHKRTEPKELHEVGFLVI